MQNLTLDAAGGSEYIRVFHINVLIALYNKHEYRTLFNDFNSFLSVTNIFTYVSASIIDSDCVYCLFLKISIIYEYEYICIAIDNYFSTLHKYTISNIFILTVDKRNVYIISMGVMRCGNNFSPGLGAIGSYLKH